MSNLVRICLIATAIAIPWKSATALDESESLRKLVHAIGASDDASVQAALLRGMRAGLEGRRDVPAPGGWADLQEKLASSGDPNVQSLANELAQIFGDQAAAAQALAVLQDAQSETTKRLQALNSLLAQRDERVLPMLRILLDDPDLRLAAIRGYATLADQDAPEILMQRYDKWSPADRRAALETLASRKPYAEVLLGAIGDQRVRRDEIPAHVARSLSLILGERFDQQYGTVAPLAAERVAKLEHFKRLISDEALAAADAAAGRAVFQKTCASCHVLYGSGANIGPDLTGSNRANLDYLLLNSVDPSYDVPDGYKMVLIQTVDGRVLNGVVASEDATRVVLKTVQDPEVVVLKSDIEARKISDKSMMPDGQLDQLKPAEVIDLVKYLQTTQQVELPQ
ncbi:c-type cytochrome [Stieleria varia]|uniref:Cytochrome c n=1 Tax=Stieleria varia TaxID=2528005 RepID=A0A5C6AMH7_9BACT|nr:c-type cytochrome [Stieleria varia]TWU01215.1 Cytochrome c [Stieleria varia]